MDAVWNLLAPVLGWAGEMLAGRGSLWEYFAICSVLSKMNKADFVVIARFFKNFVQLLKGGVGGVVTAVKVGVQDGVITEEEAKEVGEAMVKGLGYLINSVVELILAILPIINWVVAKFRKGR